MTPAPASPPTWRRATDRELIEQDHFGFRVLSAMFRRRRPDSIGSSAFYVFRRD